MIFFYCQSTCGYTQKNNVSMQHKNRHLYIFLLVSGTFSLKISIFLYLPFHNSTIFRGVVVAGPASRRVFTWLGGVLSTLSEWKMGLREVVFSRQFRTPDEIARRLSGVWLLDLPKYFNLFSFFLNTSNYMSPWGGNYFSHLGNAIRRLPLFEPCPSL